MATTGKAPRMKLNDGNEIPILALGTGGIGTGKGPFVADIPESLTWAIKAGYRHIDTATVYNNEDIIGERIAAAFAGGLVTREELFITTKLPNSKHARHQVVPTLKESLALLRMHYVDLYLIHFPLSTKEDGSVDNIDYLETWKGMEEAKELGLAKSIGVSNFNQRRLDRLIAHCSIKPAVNQIEVHPAMTSEQLVAHCHNLGITVMAYSPLGFLAERVSPGSSRLYLDDPLLLAIGERHRKTVAQVLLRYSIDRGLIPVPKSTNKARIAQNIDLFDFKLTADELAALGHFNQDRSVMKQLMLQRLNEFPY